VDVTLKPITRDNWLTCIKLHVSADQVNFVAPNALSLAEARFNPECSTLGLFDGEQMVGFAMYGYDGKEDAYWIIRLMVAQDLQGKGYGKAAMLRLIAMLRATGVKRLRISYSPLNEVARRLYTGVGFRITGEIIDDEEVAEFDLSAA